MTINNIKTMFCVSLKHGAINLDVKFDATDFKIDFYDKNERFEDFTSQRTFCIYSTIQAEEIFKKTKKSVYFEF